MGASQRCPSSHALIGTCWRNHLSKEDLCAIPEVIVLGHKCTYEGCILDESKVAKVCTWLPCKTVSDVHAFLGTAGTMCIWIKDFSSIARPLIDLTRKDADFVWQDEHNHAMKQLKTAIITSPALIPIDYKSKRKVYLAVDSSFWAVGWILSKTARMASIAHHNSAPLDGTNVRVAIHSQKLSSMACFAHYRPSACTLLELLTLS